MIRLPPTPPLFPYTTLFRSSTVIQRPTNDGRDARNCRTSRQNRSRRATDTLDTLLRMAYGYSYHELATSGAGKPRRRDQILGRSEEHTSELQSRQYLVCRLL